MGAVEPKKKRASPKMDQTHPLTTQQEDFCRAMATGKSQYAALLEAVPAAAGWKRSSCDVEGSKMMRNPKVALRIQTLRAPSVRRVGQTIDDHVAKLQELRDIAIGNGQMGAAVTAEMASGKVRGFYVEKVQVEVGSFPSLAAARKALALDAINIEIARREALPPPDIEDVEIKE